MFNFLNLKPDAFGLDISDFYLKAAKLKNKGRFFRLSSWGEIEIKPGLIQEGEIKDEDELAKTIEDGLKKINGEKINMKRVIASLPEKRLFLQVIQLPRMKKEELKKAISFEAENYIPLSIEEVYLDYQVIQPFYGGLDHLDVMIVASPKKIVDSYVSCLKKAGLKPVALEIESQSIVRSLIKNELSECPVLLIDFGRSATSLIVFSGRAMRFTSTISISSQLITETIARDLNIKIEEAEKLKIKYGLEPGENFKGQEHMLAKKTSEAGLFILNQLVSQVKKCVDFYQTHTSHEHLSPKKENYPKKIEKIIICGKGASLKGMVEFLSLELSIPVKLGNPWENILSPNQKEVPDIPFKESLGYAEALGLALRGVNKKL